MKRLLVLGVLAVVAACLMAAASSASPPTLLSVSPTAPVVGDSLVFSGCGYTPGIGVQLQAVHNTKTVTDILQIDEIIDTAGCFSTANSPYTVPDAGKWTATVWEQSQKDAKLIFAVG